MPKIRPMRAYVLRGKGLDDLGIEDRPTPKPARDEVLVKLRAASLNYRDLLIAKGQYGRGTPHYPLVPLSDGAGEVVEVGSGIAGVVPGERVVGSFFRDWIDGPADDQKRANALGGAIDGVLSEYVAFRGEALVKIPEALSFEEAATLPCAGVTAWVSLASLGHVRSTDTVLAMGTGGVSIFALQIAKAYGARVILTSSSDEKLTRGEALGASDLINYRRTPNWDERARELTGGRGVDHLIEVGGAQTLEHSLRALRDGGHLALVGLLSGARAEPAVAAAYGHDLRIDPIYVGSTEHLRSLADAAARLGIRPVIDRTYDFGDARRAYEDLERGEHFGKLVIRA